MAYRQEPVIDAAAWRGQNILDENTWTITLSGAQVAELKGAVDRLSGEAASPMQFSKADFPLPGFAALTADVLAAVEGGRGFVRLRGLPVAEWSIEQARLGIWGIGTHLGTAVPQDGAGALLHDVRDIGRKFGSDDAIRYFQTNQAIALHNDGGDIFALCCLKQGRSGGRSRLVSAVEVFNEITRRRPDLAAILQQNFHVDARNQHPQGERCQVIPVFAFEHDVLTFILKTAYIESAQRFADVPRLRPEQREALQLLAQVLEEDGMPLDFDLSAGDVLIASNHTIMHGRSDYEDGDAGQRHMLRLWLTIPDGRPLPAHYANTREFATTYAARHDEGRRV